MTTFRRVSVVLDDLADRLPFGVAAYQADILLEVAGILVPATPVRTGRTRGGWRSDLNAATEAILGQVRLDPQGTQALAEARNVAEAIRPGDRAILSNATPYLPFLNRGSSPQAPPKFIEQSVQQGLDAARAKREARGFFRDGR